MIRCRLFGHAIFPAAAKIIETAVPSSGFVFVQQQPMTSVLFRCRRCEWASSVLMPGHWALAELTGDDPERREFERLVKL